MKKIMFNDKYGLQRAAIDGTKPMTRRAVPDKWQTPLTEIFEDCNYDYSQFLKISDVQFITNEKAPYKVGEVVAIAQSYKDVGYTKEWVLQHVKPNPNAKPTDPFEKRYPGWNNKMFVKAELMLNFIQFTDLKIERLQDISDEDVYKEGFKCISVNNGWGNYANHWEAMLVYYDKLGRTKTIQSRDPRDAFSYLIDKVSGRGTWERNPWVFAYTFDLLQVK